MGARWCGVEQRSKPYGPHTAETHFHTLGHRPQPAWMIPQKIAPASPDRLAAHLVSPHPDAGRYPRWGAGWARPPNGLPRVGASLVGTRWGRAGTRAAHPHSSSPYSDLVFPDSDRGPPPTTTRLHKHAIPPQSPHHGRPQETPLHGPSRAWAGTRAAHQPHPFAMPSAFCVIPSAAEESETVAERCDAVRARTFRVEPAWRQDDVLRFLGCARNDTKGLTVTEQGSQ